MPDLSLLQPQDPMPVCLLTADDYAAAATTLGCEVPAIEAVTGIEAPSGPFDAEGRPTILFERHVFHSLTNGIYDTSNPDISNPVPGGYGPYSAQYGRLAEAAALNLDAALKSTSWGAFQLLGVNFAACGFPDVEAMVTAMRSGDVAHLQAFVAFIQSEAALVTSIQQKDWVTFSIHYNGRGEARNGYDQKIAAKYESIIQS